MVAYSQKTGIWRVFRFIQEKFSDICDLECDNPRDSKPLTFDRILPIHRPE